MRLDLRSHTQLDPFLPTLQDWQQLVDFPPPCAPDTPTRLQQLQNAIHNMRQPNNDDVISGTTSSFLARVHAGLQDPAAMQAGMFTRCRDVWTHYASLWPDDLAVQQVLSWIDSGVRLEFCTPNDPPKTTRTLPRPENASSPPYTCLLYTSPSPRD